jgi:hypothetical protein
VFFAPRDRPELAGVIFLEHGEHGPTAAPIARHVIETYFAKKDGQPLPSVAPFAPAPAPAEPEEPALAGQVARAEAPRPESGSPGAEARVR